MRFQFCNRFWRPVDWMIRNRPRVFGWLILIGIFLAPAALATILAELVIAGKPIFGSFLMAASVATFSFGMTGLGRA